MASCWIANSLRETCMFCCSSVHGSPPPSSQVSGPAPHFHAMGWRPVEWCSWLSRQSNTLKVPRSSLGSINFSCLLQVEPSLRMKGAILGSFFGAIVFSFSVLPTYIPSCKAATASVLAAWCQVVLHWGTLTRMRRREVGCLA